MRHRHGFTITELLVAMALIMFIMAILSTAFVAGLTAFRDLKAVGDMDQKLRAVLVALQRDLSDAHFTDGSGNTDKTDTVASPPAAPFGGFFLVYQGSPSTTLSEGNDADGLPSFRAVNHSLYFTVCRDWNFTKGLMPPKYARHENYLVANVAGSTPTTAPGPLSSTSPFMDGQNYLSLYGEVAYFLNGPVNQTPNGTNLYLLYRQQAVLAGPAGTAASPYTGNDSQAITNPGSFNGLSSSGTHFNTMVDVYTATNRYLSGGVASGTAPTFTPRTDGSDVMLTNVISFSVRALQTTGADFQDIPAAGGVNIYDSSSTTGYKIQALEITIRVWDEKTQQARQVTLIQSMGANE
jgi:hypothetical protein